MSFLVHIRAEQGFWVIRSLLNPKQPAPWYRVDAQQMLVELTII